MLNTHFSKLSPRTDWKRLVMAERAGRAPPAPLTAKEERVVLNLMQQGKSNLAIINHFTTQDMELTLEQVRCGAAGSAALQRPRRQCSALHRRPAEAGARGRCSEYESSQGCRTRRLWPCPGPQWRRSQRSTRRRTWSSPCADRLQSRRRASPSPSPSGRPGRRTRPRSRCRSGARAPRARSRLTAAASPSAQS